MKITGTLSEKHFSQKVITYILQLESCYCVCGAHLQYYMHISVRLSFLTQRHTQTQTICSTLPCVFNAQPPSNPSTQTPSGLPTWMCALRFPFWAKVEGQNSHSWGRSPVCLVMWICKAPFWLKDLLHCSHTKGRSPGQSRWLTLLPNPRTCNAR